MVAFYDALLPVVPNLSIQDRIDKDDTYNGWIDPAYRGDSVDPFERYLESHVTCLLVKDDASTDKAPAGTPAYKVRPPPNCS